jgi:hypothetical protein
MNLGEYLEIERNEVLEELDLLDVYAREECFDAIKGNILIRVISCLPIVLDKNTNVEVIKSVLMKFFLLSETISFNQLTEKQVLECQSKLKMISCYEILFHYFNHYTKHLFRQYIGIIICNFHCWIPLLKKYIYFNNVKRKFIFIFKR